MRYGWSLDKADWEAVEHLLAAHAPGWERVHRLEPELELMVPTSPGVYAIGARPVVIFPGVVRDMFDIVYIGQTLNLRSRYSQHCKTPSPEVQRAKDCFGQTLEYRFLRLPATTLDSVESALITCLGPPANRISGRIKAIIKPAIAV
jgi:hypothetical protein